MTAAVPALEAIAGFAGTLRDAGFRVGVREQQALVQTALALPLGESRRLRGLWRAVVCTGREQWRRYPELFDAYWYPRRRRGSTRMQGEPGRRRNLAQAVQQLRAELDAQAAAKLPPLLSGATGATDEVPARADGAQGGASRAEPLHQRPFARWSEADLDRLHALAEQIAERLRHRLLRRCRPAAAGGRLDLRRTLRASLRTGGLPLQPAWRARRCERPRVFVLVDVSRSMELHAPLFLRVARALVQALRARAFVFHTRLAEIAELLRKCSGRVQEKIDAVTFGFGAGTRIGASLADFAAAHARGQLGRGATVMVLSDGFDADPPDGLAVAVARIKRSGARIVRLHPTQKLHLSAALAQAAPLVDNFFPAYSLESLERLAQSFGRPAQGEPR